MLGSPTRRRYRLGVRTEDSQSSNTGSIPVSATILLLLSRVVSSTSCLISDCADHVISLRVAQGRQLRAQFEAQGFPSDMGDLRSTHFLRVTSPGTKPGRKERSNSVATAPHWGDFVCHPNRSKRRTRTRKLYRPCPLFSIVHRPLFGSKAVVVLPLDVPNGLYQTRQALARTIGCPRLQPKASWKCSILLTEPLTRNSPGECGFVCTCKRNA